MFCFGRVVVRQLLPDGPELIERFIAEEGDTSARRSAFLFLYNEAEELAIDFLNDRMEHVSHAFVLVFFLVLSFVPTKKK